MRTLLIINPTAHRGRAAKLQAEIEQTLTQLGVDYALKQTERPRHGIGLTEQAVLDGYERVVAVGGDGTCNEVVNGLILAAQAGNSATFGVIPVGSGNDFAHVLGIPVDVSAACAILHQGQPRQVDVGQITVDGQPCFFCNSVGLGLEAEVTIQSTQVKLLHGFAMYLWSALRVIAAGRWPYEAVLSINEQRVETSLTLMAVGNGVRSGGGFYLTPTAKLDDGLFDICYGPALSRLALLHLLPKTLHGGHLSHEAVTLIQAAGFELTVAEGMPAHVDGEVMCTDGKAFKFEILPQGLSVWVGKSVA